MKKLFLGLTPFVAVGALNLWAFANEDRFPNPMATHWGITGQPDGFASLVTHMTWTNFGLGLVALIWLIVTFIKTPVAIKRIFLLIVGYLFAVLFLLMTYLLVIQLDVTDPTAIRFGGWMLLFLAPVLGLLPLMLSMPKVTISEQLKISLLGFPLLTLDLAQVNGAAISKVRASDFGGWGLRYANKTTAFVPSSGSALQLDLQDGTKVLIRNDDPQELVDLIMGRKAN